ncbi:hypothetical protein Gohar_016012, partial [Gossypium harknessii]|nr:hypothetical protein [Gossypium harknessii]
NTEENFQKKILNERIARLSGGIAILQVGAQTQVELKDKQLRIEDALNATKAAIEEGVVVGGGCILLRLSEKVDSIKNLLDNQEQKVLSNNDTRYGYNAARNSYEDLIKAGIMDPTKVVRCCLEHAASVAKVFLTSDAVVVDIVDNMDIKFKPKLTRKKIQSLTKSFFPKKLFPRFSISALTYNLLNNVEWLSQVAAIFQFIHANF